MMKSPKIGLPMRLELETRRFYLGRDYSEALEHFGGVPFHISLIPKRSYLTETLKNLDGILLPGSDTDVDPHRFGEEPHSRLKKVIFEKEETDILLLEEAEKLKLPILGICFGMQVLNVARGGSLYQDIEAQIPESLKHEQGIPHDRNSHHIEIENESILLNLSGEKTVKVNSHHHQSIKSVGTNLKATARARDCVIEGIEDTRNDRCVLGVQWHPELNWKNDKFSENIFVYFIEQASKFALNRRK